MRKSGAFVGVILSALAGFGQVGGRAPIALTDPGIQYKSAVQDPVAELNHKLQNGSSKLAFDRKFGYLPALLNALGIPVESQLMVFSKTSLQSMLISPANPRAIFFNDAVTVAWIRGSPILEVTSQDPVQGMIFYSLDQSQQTRPALARDTDLCTGCHNTPSSLGVPGTIVRTVFPKDTGVIVTELIGSEVDHRTSFAERWGGWYVTGKQGPPFHRANVVVESVREAGDTAVTAAPERREPLQEKFSTTGYLTPYSDIVALTIFEHQKHMMNLITRMGWDTRIALHRSPDKKGSSAESFLQPQIEEFVDYLLFIDEAPMMGRIEGTSGFAERFARLGPFDSKGRSLRQFDLHRRLMQYPCSYMIYSDAFNALPLEAKSGIYKRMWSILSGAENKKKYSALSFDDRKAVVAILRETVKDLPDYFVQIR